MNKRLENLKDQYVNIEIPSEIVERTDKTIMKSMEKMYKKNRMMKQLTAACIAITVSCGFVTAVNVNTAFAKSLGNIPVVDKIVRIAKFDTVKVNDEKMNISIDVPQVDGLSDKAAQDAINKALTESAKKIEEQARLEAIERQKDAQENGRDSYLPVIISQNFQVKSITDKFLSFALIKTEIGAGAYETLEFYNIDLETSQKLMLKDLFKENTNYIDVISQNIKKQMAEEMKDTSQGKVYFIDEFKKISPQQNFYINTEGKLVISFNEYEVAPGMMGTPEFVIEADDIASMLADNGWIN